MSKQLIQQSMSASHEETRVCRLGQLPPASKRLLGLGPRLCPTAHLIDPDTLTDDVNSRSSLLPHCVQCAWLSSSYKAKTTTPKTQNLSPHSSLEFESQLAFSTAGISRLVSGSTDEL